MSEEKSAKSKNSSPAGASSGKKPADGRAKTAPQDAVGNTPRKPASGDKTSRPQVANPAATGPSDGNRTDAASGADARKTGASETANTAAAGQGARDKSAATADGSGPSSKTARSVGARTHTASDTTTGHQRPAPSDTSAKQRSPSTPVADTSGRGGAASSAGGGAGSGRPNRKGRFALIVAVLALIVAVLALLGAGYLWYRGQQRLADLDQEINSASNNVQNNLQQQIDPKVSKLDSQMNQMSSQVSQISQTQQSRDQQFDSLQQSVQQVRSQNANLQSALGGNHEQFVEQRILSLLEAANQRLVIYHDPEGARQALNLADQAIAHAGYPQLHPVRDDIADEMAALDALPQPDIEGLALKLSKLSAQVPKLPTATQVPSTYHNGNTGSGGAASGNSSDAGSAGSDSWTDIQWQAHWQRLTQTLGNALSHMVTVRSANGTQNAPALMAPDQSFFLVQNLQLELRMARLALLDRNGEVYHSSLSEARDWTSKYFDTSDSATQSVLDSLKQLADVQLDWKAPDISASLTTMRRIMSTQGLSGSEAGSPGAGSGNTSSGTGGGGSDASPASGSKTNAASGGQSSGSDGSSDNNDGANDDAQGGA